jgi:rod shape-determining protein MreC
VPTYSVSRRRAIVLLVLSSVLLLTIDLRGNPVIDRVRSVFAKVLSPFETAGQVVVTPIRNAWHGATDYHNLERENERLLNEIARQRGDQLTARAVVSEYQELLTLNGLTAKYPTVTARVVGAAPGNFTQTVEIDRGSNDGIRVGMVVVNNAGLVGKIHTVYDNRSVVLLANDREYAIEAKVSEGADLPSQSDTPNTTPNGLPVDLSPATTTTSATANSQGGSTSTAAPFGAVPAATSTSTSSTTSSTTSTTPANTDRTTTTLAGPVQHDTGAFEGRGKGRLPAMRFVTAGAIRVGSVVSTTGGSKSLAPPDIIIGEVINVVRRPGSAGPLLEIKLAANLAQLNFVQVVRYRPPSEVPSP